jgi:predicted nucleotidyltransferase component of viral defense system
LPGRTNDNVEFKIDHISQIRADDEYGGYRVSINSNYQSIITPLIVDLTTGDTITPGAMHHTIHSIFDENNFEIWAYPLETILVEKIETILRRSVLNTRPRDYYDIYILLKTRQNLINMPTLNKALIATTQIRSSSLVLDNYSNIIQNVKNDTEMHNRWKQYSNNNAYVRYIVFNDVLKLLEEVMDGILLN